MFRTINGIIDENLDIKAIYPVHKNLVIREFANDILGDADRIIEPLEVLNFHNSISRLYLILTDIGGIQEEILSIGKSVFVFVILLKDWRV